MHISDEGLVAGSVNRAELVAAYNEAADEAVRANLAAVGAEHGLYVEGDKLVDPSAPEPPEPEPEPEEPEPEPDVEPGRPAVNDNKAAWVVWAISQGCEPELAEAATKATLIDEYGGD